MNRPKPPPVNLEKYCEGRSRNYVSYEDGARMYSINFDTVLTGSSDKEQIAGAINTFKQIWFNEKVSLLHR